MKPYQNDAMNRIYEMLFCDDIDLYRGQEDVSEIYPWKDIFDPNEKDAALRKIAADPGLDSRQQILAANLLTRRRQSPADPKLLGVIVEVGMDEGLDVVAAYADGSARYINFSEKLIVWETRTDVSDKLIADLFSAAEVVVAQIGPWDGDRLQPPISGNARISFLVSNGLYFGEAPLEALAQDPMGGAVINAAAKLMAFLIENSLDQSA